VKDCPLTVRQHEVLLALARGLAQKQAARELGISVSTVRSHTYKIYRALGVPGAGQAFALALREGWLQPADVLGDYTGKPYTTTPRRKSCVVVTPAQRLYLDAFDELLRVRTDHAAQRLSFFYRAMCVEARVPDRRRGGRDVDSMLVALGRALTRPIAA